MLKISLLGAPQITIDDLPVTGFITRKAEALFFYLAVTRRAHMRDSIATLFWADDDHVRAKKNLRDVLPCLRDLVGDHLIITRHTVAFDPTKPYWLDVELLQNHLQQLKSASTNEEMYAATQLYRGEFLEGFHVRNAPNFEEWMLLEREHLHELYMQSLHTLAARYSLLQDYLTTLSITQQLLAREPWHEGAHRQRMMALASGGRMSEALAQYALCRRVLADELGLEPAAETTALYEQIRSGAYDKETRRQETSSSLLPVFSSSPLLSPSSPPHNLPRQFTPFFGRAIEIGAICAKLQQRDCGWLTLMGEGGVGKSRLALKVGEILLPHFRDGVWFVSLVDIVQREALVEQLVMAIGKALRIPFSGTGPLAPQLIEQLQQKELLLILDNFEHLMLEPQGAMGAPFIYNLLQETQQVKVLITSRHRFNYQAEHCFRVDGLLLPDEEDLVQWEVDQMVAQLLQYDSIALFAQRAAQSVSDFVLTAKNAREVAQICCVVEGLPLGIELAATLVQQYSCTQILAQLVQNSTTLATTFHDLPTRHHSLQATLAYSWQLLSPQEALILAQCALFHDSFNAIAATTITGADAAHLQRWESQMLLHQIGSGRYAMHELMRHYALQQLQRMPTTEQIARARHCTYFARFLQTQMESVQPNAQAFDLIWAELGNIWVSWDWGLEQGEFSILLQMLPSLARLYALAGSHHEIATSFGRAIEKLRTRFAAKFSDTPELQQLLAQLLLEQAYFYITTVRIDQAKPLIQEALAIAQRVDNPTLTTTAYLRAGDAAWAQGDHPQHRLAYQQALILAQAEGRRQSEVHCLSNLGMNCDIRGEYSSAIDYYEAALLLTRQIGDREKENVIYNNLGVSNIMLGDFSSALAYYGEALQSSRQLGDQEGSGFANLNFGLLYNSLGAWEQAKYYGERALKIFRMIDERRLEARTLAQLSVTHHYLAEGSTAASYCQQALQIARHGGYQAVEAEALTIWGQILLDRQQGAKAAACYREAAILWQALNRTGRLLITEAGLANSLLLLQEHAGALQVVERILALLAAFPIHAASVSSSILLACYRTLAANQDSRALRLLQNAHQLLQTRAAKIQSVELRRSFLEDVTAHRTIIELYCVQPEKPSF